MTASSLSSFGIDTCIASGDNGIGMESASDCRATSDPSLTAYTCGVAGADMGRRGRGVDRGVEGLEESRRGGIAEGLVAVFFLLPLVRPNVLGLFLTIFLGVSAAIWGVVVSADMTAGCGVGKGGTTS